MLLFLSASHTTCRVSSGNTNLSELRPSIADDITVICLKIKYDDRSSTRKGRLRVGFSGKALLLQQESSLYCRTSQACLHTGDPGGFDGRRGLGPKQEVLVSWVWIEHGIGFS